MNRRQFTKAGLLAGLAITTGTPAFASRDTRKIRLGIIGVGGRGTGLLRTLLKMEDVLIPAICDLLPDNLRRAQKLVEDAGQAHPEGSWVSTEKALALAFEGATSLLRKC